MKGSEIILTFQKNRLTQCQSSVDQNQGPVVQSIVSLTSSLRRQLVKYMPTTLSNTLLFFVGKM